MGSTDRVRQGKWATIVLMALLVGIGTAVGAYAQAQIREADGVLKRHFNAKRWTSKVAREHRSEQAELVFRGQAGERVLLVAPVHGARRMEVVIQFADEGAFCGLATFNGNSTTVHRSNTPLSLNQSGRRYWEHRGAWRDEDTLVQFYEVGVPAEGVENEGVGKEELFVRFVPVGGR